MSDKTIHSLKITNFKSVDSLEIKGLTPFSVFAGANGSGKSNFFDALDFVKAFISTGLENALNLQGGIDNIRPIQKGEGTNWNFGFEIVCELPANLTDAVQKTSIYRYSLTIHDIERSPSLEECLFENDNSLLNREQGQSFSISLEDSSSTSIKIPKDYSLLRMYSESSFGNPLAILILNIKIYRINASYAKEPGLTVHNKISLDSRGRNLASVLSRIESNESLRDLIMEYMELIVPGMEDIKTTQDYLDGKTGILFKEDGIERRFPAHMVSDGTIYALCILVEVLDTDNRQPCFGLTLIEEPEIGLHPKAIRELIIMMREKALPENPIWLSTHSISVVRESRMEELLLVNKVHGHTRMKSADSGNLKQADLAPLNLDEAWLSNLLNGGLPW